MCKDLHTHVRKSTKLFSINHLDFKSMWVCLYFKRSYEYYYKALTSYKIGFIISYVINILENPLRLSIRVKNYYLDLVWT